MPRRIIEVNGEPWEVAVSGRVTQYTKDEFGLVFSRGTGPDRERRVARYSPLGAKSRELSLASSATRSCATCWRTRSRRGPRPNWGTAPDLRHRAGRGRRGRSARAFHRLRRQPAAGAGGRARAGGRPGRDRPHRPRHPRRRARRARGRRAARPAGRRRLRVLLGRALGRDARPRATSSRPHSAELESFLERSRADRVRRAREMVTRLQGLGVALDFDDVLLQAQGRRRGPPPRGAGPRPAGRGRRHPEAFDRYLGRGRPAFVDKVLPSSARSPTWCTRSAAWSPSPTSRSAAPARSSSGSSARGSTRSRPATRATIPSSARGSPTSRSGSDCSGPAAATGTAIPSPARPTARSAPSRCRSNGSSGSTRHRAAPPASVGP